jgi:hypothetical protein
MTKRKRNDFFAKQNKKRPPPAGSEEVVQRPNLATINLEAGAGRAGFNVGDRVLIEGNGLYAGETAVVEKISAGVIPSAFVRTESGQTRQVRTIDLAKATESA